MRRIVLDTNCLLQVLPSSVTADILSIVNEYPGLLTRNKFKGFSPLRES